MKTHYHGSYVSVPAPLTNVGRKELDFVPGFYVTNLREQAERWARRVCVIRAADTPLLSAYEFDETQLPADIRHLRLERYDKEWLDFVVSSRRGEEPWRDYDIIEGGVANDQVIDTVGTTTQAASPPSKLSVNSASPVPRIRCASADRTSQTAACASSVPSQ